VTQSLKARMAGGYQALGCWLNMCSPIAAEIVAQAGYDFVMIDREHGPSDLMNAIHLMHAVQAHATAPYMRVPSGEPVVIKLALDIGIEGVMVPAVNSPEEATAVVEACRYPPHGIRGVATPIVRAAGYGARAEEYARSASESLLVICQIESGAAVDAAADIAAVDGVDLVFVGPYDLSANLGYLGEPDHPDVARAIAKVERAAKDGGKLLGGIPTPRRSAAELFKAGHNLVLAGADLAFIRDGARAQVAGLAKDRRREP
jgi:4-hydroxy-2-oxoheptanedioate aldolase